MRTLAIACLVVAGCVGNVPGNSSSGSGGIDCPSYCAEVMTNCSGSNAQYTAMENCMGACSAFTVGTAADTSGNTLGCRIYHAGNAATDPVTHCIHAGPSGGAACGTVCEGFCSIVESVCPTQYPTGACETLCPGYAKTPPYSLNATGNTLACRTYHAQNAAANAMSAAVHCPHTGSDGGGVCD
jgi:hypothetical protein